MMSTVVSANATRLHSDRVGGKARSLLQLLEAGFPVPGFIVSPVDVGAAVRELGMPLAVRSSASHEDGASNSFAGQFTSSLNLCSLHQVQEAIDQCHQSVESESVVEYCRRAGIAHEEVTMNVILQRMVQPVLAGVAFSVNPVTGEERVVIESCEGLADSLVAGHRAALPDDHPLLQQYREQIERTVMEIQRHFGCPQDIEFAIEDEIVYVLQSRPITRIEFAGQAGEWTNADFRDGGVSSRVCTPLMSSLYERVWSVALKATLRELHLFDREFTASRLFFGRPYWNVGEVKRCVAKLPGFKEADFDRDLNIRANYEGDGRHTPITLRGIIRAIPTLLATRRFLTRQMATASRLLDGKLDGKLDRQLDQSVVDSETCESRFRSLVDGDYLRLETEYFRTIYAVSLAKMDFLGNFPDADDRSLIASLSPLRHMAPVRAVRHADHRSSEELRKIVRTFRHHCRLGLDICLPRWDEDEPFVVEMLRGLTSSQGCDPQQRYAQARAEALARIPWRRRRAFNRKLDRLRTLVWLREELRDLSNRMYYLLRRTALSVADRRDIGDDIFMMTYAQIFTDDRDAVSTHRDTYEGYRNFRPPNEIGDRYRHRVAATRDALQGVAVSGGIARGRVFVARDVRDASRMAAGDVLVCPFTDPGWTPVLGRARAVVTETGGLLSHAAVICREYGVPAVLGVDCATERLRVGQEVVVCGDTGVVQVKPSPQSKSSK